MPNYKKIDDEDFVFIDQPFSDEERAAFSAFLKKRREARHIANRAEKQRLVSGDKYESAFKKLYGEK